MACTGADLTASNSSRGGEVRRSSGGKYATQFLEGTVLSSLDQKPHGSGLASERLHGECCDEKTGAQELVETDSHHRLDGSVSCSFEATRGSEKMSDVETEAPPGEVVIKPYVRRRKGKTPSQLTML